MMRFHRSFALFTLLALLAVPAAAEMVRNLTDTFPLEGARRLEVGVRAGEIRVTGRKRPDVLVEAEVRCSILGGERCKESARAAELAVEHHDGVLEVGFAGLPEGDSPRGLSVHLLIEAPGALSLTADLGAGEMRVTGLEADLDLNVGVGKVEVLAPAAAVGAVHLATGVGDVDLLVHNRSVAEGGMAFVGRTLRWEEGAGKARLEVDCGVGSVRVSLD